MGEPTTGESKQAAAARMIIYTWYYVFGEFGPNTPVPDIESGDDVVVGTLEPGKSLKLITPSGHAGVLFQKGSVDENRIIILSENSDPHQYGDSPCNGPQTTELCQYPLFYNIESLPDGPLLKLATAAVCHPPEGTEGGPVDATAHDRLRLSHTAPSNPADYVPGGIVRTAPAGVENIEILPKVSQSFFPNCSGIVWDNPIDIGLLQRGLHLASVLASRVGKFLTPGSAFAIDQGAGGTFLDFSPFNNVDPCSGPTPEPYPTCPSD